MKTSSRGRCQCTGELRWRLILPSTSPNMTTQWSCTVHLTPQLLITMLLHLTVLMSAILISRWDEMISRHHLITRECHTLIAVWNSNGCSRIAWGVDFHWCLSPGRDHTIIPRVGLPVSRTPLQAHGMSNVRIYTPYTGNMKLYPQSKSID